MPKSIQADHFPEVVEGGKGTRRLELLQVKEDLASPSERRNFFKDLSTEDYHKMICYVNSIVRNKTIEYEYEDGQIHLESTPVLDEKHPLMTETFETVKAILSNEDMDDETALQTAGLAVAGAVNYIHPFLDGNGRAGRVLHYLIEFGSERGDENFDNELYAIIGKLPLYEGELQALNDTPPYSLYWSLKKSVMRRLSSEQYREMDSRTLAAYIVREFLSMMRGDTEVPLIGDGKSRESYIPNRPTKSYVADSSRGMQSYKSGEIDGVSAYRKTYLGLSTIPNRSPGYNPSGANREIGKKSSEDDKMTIDMGLIDMDMFE